MHSNRSIPLFSLTASALLSTLGCDLTTTVDVTVNQSAPTGTGSGGGGGGTTTNNGGAGGEASGTGGQGGGGDACTVADDCPGQDTDCSVRTCIGQQCGVDLTAAGTPIATQTPGDCALEVCDGSGSVESSADDADLPNDGNPCTDDVCTGGSPSSTPVSQGTSCGPDLVCDGLGSCVGCVDSMECPGQDDECQTRTCFGGMCGLAFTAAGTPVAMQAPGDCQQNQCDGHGAIVNAVDNADLPADDGNQCTDQACIGGAPAFSPSPAGAPCAQGGGTSCDGAGTCVVAPQVDHASPADGATPAASTSIAVTFTAAMNPATLTGQTTAGACSGSIQVSLDDFVSCVAFSSALATMSDGDTVATFTAAPGLLVNRVHKIRVTAAAASADGLSIGSPFTQINGFNTTSPNLCDGSVVISQVYANGGATSATYSHDFVELHNRGTTTVSLTDMSLQYTSNTGTVWNNPVVLSGSIAPGGYFLVQLGTNGGGGGALPTPDQSAPTINMNGTAGKIALINSPAQIPDGACPPPALTIDFVGYGAANCREGTLPTPAHSIGSAAVRVRAGCGDVNQNSDDFATLAVTPRSSGSAPSVCLCTVQNESTVASEVDYCTVQFPPSLNMQTGTPTPLIFGQIFELGMTEAAGPNTTVRAQVGHGPATANPKYEASWQWTNATFNVQAGNNDEYQAVFTAPAVGSYRYGYRFSLNQGVSWTYCDGNTGDFGAGSAGGFTFELEDVPTLVVNP